MEVPHPIAAGTAWKGGTVKGGALCHRRGDATGGSAFDRPVLEGYTIGSG